MVVCEENANHVSGICRRTLVPLPAAESSSS
jgi:hypothetical protein